MTDSLSHTPTTGRRCDVHPHFRIEATTAHIAGSNLYYTDIRMSCAVCGVAMAFRGPMGLNPAHPTVRPDGSEVTLPAVPEGEELRSAEPLARFSVTAPRGTAHDA